MKLSTIRRILKEDLQKAGDIPDWVDQLLTPLNQFIDVITIGLRNGVTLSENISGKLVTIRLDHGVEAQVSPDPLKTRVIGMIPLSTDVQVLDKHGFQYKSNGNIGVTFYFSDTGAKQVPCRLYFITG